MIRSLFPIIIFAFGIYVVYRVNYHPLIKRKLYGFFIMMTIANLVTYSTVVAVYFINSGQIDIDPKVFGSANSIVAIISQLIRIFGFMFIYQLLKYYEANVVGEVIP
jgi:hypothetical protein